MNNNDSTSEGEYCIPETEITSSRCITESFTATLDFEVTDDAQLKGMRVGEFVASRVFIVRGYKWSIRFCPNGQCYCAECAGHASAFLGCGSQAKPVIAKYALSLLGKHGQAPVASFDTVEYRPGDGWWGYHRFVEKSRLSSLSRLNNGRFTIRCVLTIRDESPPLELPGHLENMLGDAMAMGADIVFRVGGQELHAHRSVLAARSPVFRAQFFGSAMDKDDMPRPEVGDMEPAIFQMLLHYIYTDSLPRCHDGEGGRSVAR
jgi:speckle-type POZ protein